jgi:hypothetical protein
LYALICTIAAGVLREDRLHRGIDIDRVARHRAEAGRLQAERLERARHALQTGLAVAVVLVEHADAPQADRGDLLDDLGGLVEMRGTHMERAAVERRAQRLGAGERRDEGQAALTSGSAASEVGVPM